MSTIQFGDKESCVELVQSSVKEHGEYLDRIKAADIKSSHSDCSSFKSLFSHVEFDNIIQRISKNLMDKDFRLYHGCRYTKENNPQEFGLKPSCTDGIEASLLKLVESDDVLSSYKQPIQDAIRSDCTKEQADARKNQIWFCFTKHSMINTGGVYIIFGSEYRLFILNSVSKDLKNRLLQYGIPSYVTIDLPFFPYFKGYEKELSKYLFSLWVHFSMEFEDSLLPDGFGFWVEDEIPPKFIKSIMSPEKAYDDYNLDSRWYTKEEMIIDG